MNDLYIFSTYDTPSVNFKPQEGQFHIQGISHPENAMEFYEPLLQWFRGFCREQLEDNESPKRTLVLSFLFRHFNSMSYRAVGHLCRIFSLLQYRHECIIEWQYEPDDVDMREAGEDFFAVLGPDFPTRIVEAPERMKDFNNSPEQHFG